MTRPGIVFIVPAGIDDPGRVSGGNVYDQHVRDGLRRRGWAVTTVEASDGAAVASALRAADDGALVLVDGLAACWAPADVEASSSRVRLVLLMHMVAAVFPDADIDTVAAERRAAQSARRVIATSRWTADELVGRGLSTRDRVTVAAPGVAAAEVGVPDGDDRFLCVGVLAPHKGQDTLLAALTRLREADWSCAIVGSAEPYPRFAARIQREAQALGGRVTLTGVLTGDELAEMYRRSAVLVAPSRVESAGMAVGEARGRGLPVVAAATGGIPDTVAGGGAVLVRPGDADELAAALHAWMSDPGLRARLRREALAARDALPRWDDTIESVAAALESA